MMKNLSCKLKYSLAGAIIVPVFGRIALSGTGHATEYWRYLVPIFVGAIAGFMIGKMKDRWILKTKTLKEEIKHRKSIEKELLTQKERLAVTLHSIGDGVITTDINGKIELINKITEDLTGWTQSEAVGRPIQEVFNIINENTGQPADNPVKKVLATKRIVDLANHTALIARDGTRYIIEDSGAPIFDREHEIVGTVLVYRDVTLEQKTKAELMKIKKLDSVGILAGGIAHDFNNILAAILGNIELAQIYTEPSSKARPLLTAAKKALIRARDLTQQLLTFAKGGEPVRKITSIDKIITESANFVLHGSPTKCAYNIPEDLWPVNVDSGQISQVIQNIIINAREAMPAGGIIEVCCKNIAEIKNHPTLTLPGQKYIRITLEDSGSGIPAKNIDKIFDPYFSDKPQGSGLGLSICHSIITKHNGSIAVESKIGQGTRFTIYLPVSQATNSKNIPPQSPDVETAAKSTILVMDDELMIREMLKQMLSELGHDVLLAENGFDTIEIYREHYTNNRPIDLIIMDLTIPGGMGGRDAVRGILKINPEAKVVVASGYATDPVMSRWQDYGFKAAIAKPFQLAELTKLIAAVTGRK